MTIHQLLAALWRRRLTVLISVVVTIAAAFGYSYARHATYTATATVDYQVPSSTVSGASGSSGFTLPAQLQQPLEVLVEPATVARVPALVDPRDLLAADAKISGAFDPTSGAVTVSASSASPVAARDAANANAKALVAEVHAIVSGVVTDLQGKIATLSAQVVHLQQEAAAGSTVAGAELVAANDALGNLYTEMTNLQTEESSIAEFAQPATTPTTPNGLSKIKLGGLALLVGLLAGCGIAFVTDQYDTRLRAGDVGNRLAEAPVLAKVPLEASTAHNHSSNGSTTMHRPDVAVIESMRELRTNLRVALEDTSAPVIMVTSPEPRDGKTFTTANLSIVWAMGGQRVVALSADLRHSTLEQKLGIGKAAHGLIDLAALDRREFAYAIDESPDKDGSHARRWLPSRTEVVSLLVATKQPGLWILPSGGDASNPSELLDGPAMATILHHLKTFADVVIVDTPPTLVVADAAILGRQVDGVVVVASDAHTSREAIDRTVDRLTGAHSKILGVVINRAQTQLSKGYLDYYGAFLPADS